MLHTRPLPHCLRGIRQLWGHPIPNLRAHRPILRDHTHTQAAAGALIRHRLASLLGLQVKEEGHHICKRGGVTGAAAPPAVFPEGPRARREREEFLSPPPRAEEPRTLLLVSGQRERPLAHGRSCQAPTLWPHVPRLLAWEQDRWCPSCFSISSLDLRSQLVGGSHFRRPPLPPPQTLLSSPLPPLAGFLPCTSSLGPGSPAPPHPTHTHPRGGPHLAGSCTAGSILASCAEAKARASSWKRRRPSSVSFQRQARGQEPGPAARGPAGTFSKLPRKQRLWRMVFFQPSGAVRKKGKCCLRAGGRERSGPGSRAGTLGPPSRGGSAG